jgi:hypothetical protein
MANTSPAGDKQFSEIIGRIFSDDKFAQGLEQNPEKALRDAGYKLDAGHLKALSNAAQSREADSMNVAAFTRPVVSVAVRVVVSSAVVASTAEKEKE